ILRPPEHLSPEAFRFEWIFTKQNLSQPARDVMAERSIDDGFNHFRRRVRFANPFHSIVRAHPHQHNILRTGRLFLHARHTQDLANDLLDAHRRSIDTWFDTEKPKVCWMQRSDKDLTTIG